MNNDPRDVEIARRAHCATPFMGTWNEAHTTPRGFILAARLSREAAEAKPKEQTMTDEELDRARAAEATRQFLQPGGQTPAIIAARLARTGWTPPPKVDPELAIIADIALKWIYHTAFNGPDHLCEGIARDTLAALRAPVAEARVAAFEEFVRMVARLDHSNDDGFTHADDPDDALYALDGLIAKAREIERSARGVV